MLDIASLFVKDASSLSCIVFIFTSDNIFLYFTIMFLTKYYFANFVLYIYIYIYIILSQICFEHSI